jgi:cyclomaltodextrinase
MSGPTEAVAKDWVKHSVWWQIYPIGFLGADPTGESRSAERTLDQLEIWLDYAIDLGASGLALGPIFSSATHGYDTTDHLRIDERLGDQTSFARLVEQCRARGLRLLLDGVFNHVGRGHPRFQQALAGDQESARWFVTEPDGGYRTFEGHPGLITLNHAEPAVVDYVVEVMTHWLDAGADGWRLDAAYCVPNSFWAQVLPRVRAVHPQAYVVGEVIHGDYSATVAATGFDAVTQYELWKAIWSSLNDRNLFELAWALKRHVQMLATFIPMTFVGNHDVTRIASRLQDERNLGHALALLFTLPGTPSVYAGDEQGFQAIKEDRAGGDDAVRPAFPAAGPSALADHGRPIYRIHQLLIGFRRRHPWLEHANVSVLQLSNTFLAYECRHQEQAVVVALNLSDQQQALELPFDVDELLTQPDRLAKPLQGRALQVEAHSWGMAAGLVQ